MLMKPLWRFLLMHVQGKASFRLVTYDPELKRGDHTWTSRVGRVACNVALRCWTLCTVTSRVLGVQSPHWQGVLPVVVTPLGGVQSQLGPVARFHHKGWRLGSLAILQRMMSAPLCGFYVSLSVPWCLGCVGWQQRRTGATHHSALSSPVRSKSYAQNIQHSIDKQVEMKADEWRYYFPVWWIWSWG